MQYASAVENRTEEDTSKSTVSVVPLSFSVIEPFLKAKNDNNKYLNCAALVHLYQYGP